MHVAVAKAGHQKLSASVKKLSFLISGERYFFSFLIRTDGRNDPVLCFDGLPSGDCHIGQKHRGIRYDQFSHNWFPFFFYNSRSLPHPIFCLGRAGLRFSCVVFKSFLSAS